MMQNVEGREEYEKVFYKIIQKIRNKRNQCPQVMHPHAHVINATIPSLHHFLALLLCVLHNKVEKKKA